MFDVDDDGMPIMSSVRTFALGCASVIEPRQWPALLHAQLHVIPHSVSDARHPAAATTVHSANTRLLTLAPPGRMLTPTQRHAMPAHAQRDFGLGGFLGPCHPGKDVCSGCAGGGGSCLRLVARSVRARRPTLNLRHMHSEPNTRAPHARLLCCHQWHPITVDVQRPAIGAPSLRLWYSLGTEASWPP